MSSFGHGLREELRGTGVSVTLLHPGTTATEFHHHAGMDATRFGDNRWKNDPVLVARHGVEAMLNGVSSVDQWG
ncbi:dehydrogenase DhgA [Roseobacter sp. GAI101]|nr:dehydrogenase DhgA [Roseobacter sp. GAI101]